jgi:hypothetical protein
MSCPGTSQQESSGRSRIEYAQICFKGKCLRVTTITGHPCCRRPSKWVPDYGDSPRHVEILLDIDKSTSRESFVLSDDMVFDLLHKFSQRQLKKTNDCSFLCTHEYFILKNITNYLRVITLKANPGSYYELLVNAELNPTADVKYDVKRKWPVPTLIMQESCGGVFSIPNSLFPRNILFPRNMSEFTPNSLPRIQMRFCNLFRNATHGNLVGLLFVYMCIIVYSVKGPCTCAVRQFSVVTDNTCKIILSRLTLRIQKHKHFWK